MTTLDVPKPMVKRIRRIVPYQAGKMVAAVCGLLSAPIALILALLALSGADGVPSVWFAPMVMPIYVLGGFLNGVFFAAAYNLMARRVGGFEVVVEDGLFRESAGWFR